MKHFREYLAESERVYKYRIKFIGDAPDDFVSELNKKLDQFDPVKIGDVKETPVLPRSTDFPKFPNEKVTMYDVEFRYPAIEPQIKQLAQLMGFDPNRIVMLTSDHCDGVVDELERTESENKDLLTDTDYPADTQEQKDLIADYSAPYGEHQVLRNQYRSDFTVAGGKTAAATTTNDYKLGTQSPMSKIKLPPRPETGSSKRG